MSFSALQKHIINKTNITPIQVTPVPLRPDRCQKQISIMNNFLTYSKKGLKTVYDRDSAEDVLILNFTKCVNSLHFKQVHKFRETLNYGWNEQEKWWRVKEKRYEWGEVVLRKLSIRNWSVLYCRLRKREGEKERDGG